MGFMKATETFVAVGNTYKNVVLFGGSLGTLAQYREDGASRFPWPNFQWGQFYDADVTWFGLPADTIAIDIGGILIITGAASLTLAFRAPGDNKVLDWSYYQEQTFSPFASGGDRSVAYDHIPIVGGIFQFAAMAKNYPDDGGHPGIGTPNAVGWNLKIKKYYR